DSPEVYRRPRVAVLATGSELQAPGQLLEGAQIYDSNSAALCAAVSAAGGEPVPLGIARDDRDSLKKRISAGLEADVLVTAAGASVGEYDLVRGVLDELGA
ncbi:MAG: molybdopterin molybdenumtransferase MoeA, partial [Desulfuromonadales bacterium]|nr:molybdopterin molybdenumtransferase MoeA [Desulfuromonadales bacterium]